MFQLCGQVRLVEALLVSVMNPFSGRRRGLGDVWQQKQDERVRSEAARKRRRGFQLIRLAKTVRRQVRESHERLPSCGCPR
jgi:hypothetical protein